MMNLSTFNTQSRNKSVIFNIDVIKCFEPYKNSYILSGYHKDDVKDSFVKLINLLNY
jgi:hypothetical protein